MKILLIILLVVAVIIAVVNKIVVITLTLYIKEIDKIPSEEIIRQYAHKALKQFFHNPK